MRKPREFDTADGKRWRVRFRLGTTETSETFRRKQDADTFAAILGNGKDGRTEHALEWLEQQRAQRTATTTFGQWFDLYVDQLTDVTKGTRADYHAMHRRYLTSLDPLPLTVIGRAHITGLVNRLADDLSPKTIRNVMHMLSSCLAVAIEEGLIAKNPCKGVRLPKARPVEEEVRFFTAEEFWRLAASTPEHYQPLVTFLVGSGLRWSEATALQSRHVDIANGTVRVLRAWKRVPGAGFEIGPPKSEKGNRTVNPAALGLAAVQPLLGKPNDYVFTTPTGKVVRHSNFYNRIWQPACIAAGLGRHVKGPDGKPKWEGPSPHDLRHTFASWMISDGVSLEAVQDQLGHEDIKTTRAVYAKLLPAVGVAAGRAASAALARALPHGLDFSTPPPAILAARVAEDGAHPHGVGTDLHGGGHGR